jgi:hypothetical protein
MKFMLFNGSVSTAMVMLCQMNYDGHIKPFLTLQCLPPCTLYSVSFLSYRWPQHTILKEF